LAGSINGILFSLLRKTTRENKKTPLQGFVLATADHALDLTSCLLNHQTLLVTINLFIKG